MECQLEEQLFRLYYKERSIDDVVGTIKGKQQELDQLVRDHQFIMCRLVED